MVLLSGKVESPVSSGRRSCKEVKTHAYKLDYDQYVMLRTVPADMVSVAGHGRRVIIIGDVHGSFVPLQ